MLDALGILEAKAIFGGKEFEANVRMAEAGDLFYLDLCDADWRTVAIASDGWRVIENAPVRFRRARGMLSLPAPIQGGGVAALREFVNLSSDDDWVLLLAWLVAALRPNGPYPPLILTGEQGSAKTTLARMLRAIIDPNTAPMRASPRDVRDVMIAASNSWCISLDNLSHLPPWLSDALCRLSTGGGFSTRELFSDADEVIFSAQRPVILNGIEDYANRPDLLDRAIALHLPTIPDDRRRPESEMWTLFTAKLPAILGSLLTVVADARRRLPLVRLESPPRMADFAAWATAAEPSLGLPAGAVMRAFDKARNQANEIALESSILWFPLQGLLIARSGVFRGTATDLLGALSSFAEDSAKRRGWPRTPGVLSNMLRRLAPSLRSAGVAVDNWREGKDRTRMIRIEKSDASNPVASIPSASSAPPATPDSDMGKSAQRTVADGNAVMADGAVVPPSSAPNALQDGNTPSADAADKADAGLRSSSGGDCSTKNLSSPQLPLAPPMLLPAEAGEIARDVSTRQD